MEKVSRLYFKDDGAIPNNGKLPVLFYKGVFADKPSIIEETFNKNNWTNSWEGDVFDYHHYHSNTHEVLGVTSGSAVLLLGGEGGEEVTVETGDVAVLPAGTGHKKMSGSSDFQVIGAYPGGASPNKMTGKKEERPDVLRQIDKVLLPDKDPVSGNEGPLKEFWNQ